MRNYKILQLNQKQQLGNIIVNDDFSEIKIDIVPHLKQEYEVVFEKLVDVINQDGNFKAQFNNGTIEDASKEFWVAFNQELIINLQILITDR